MREHAVFEAHSSYVLGLLFSRDGRTLVSAGMDNVVKLWSVPDWTPVRTFEGHANSINSISLSPDGRTLATGSTDATVKLWAFPEGLLLHTLQDRKKVVSVVRISPDGKWVAAGSYGGRVMIWTLSGKAVVGIKASKKNLSSVIFSPDGKTLATAGLGDDISLWSLPSGEQIGTLSGHSIAVGSLRFIKAGHTLVSMGHEQTIRFWDTETWREARARALELHTPSARNLVFSPDEKTAAISMESKVQLWSVEDWALQAELPIATKAVSSLAFSPDGRWLAVGAADRKIRIWEL
jgi:WD40 repeat protein